MRELIVLTPVVTETRYIDLIGFVEIAWSIYLDDPSRFKAAPTLSLTMFDESQALESSISVQTCE